MEGAGVHAYIEIIHITVRTLWLLFYGLRIVGNKNLLL